MAVVYSSYQYGDIGAPVSSRCCARVKNKQCKNAPKVIAADSTGTQRGWCGVHAPDVGTKRDKARRYALDHKIATSNARQQVDAASARVLKSAKAWVYKQSAERAIALKRVVNTLEKAEARINALKTRAKR